LGCWVVDIHLTVKPIGSNESPLLTFKMEEDSKHDCDMGKMQQLWLWIAGWGVSCAIAPGFALPALAHKIPDPPFSQFREWCQEQDHLTPSAQQTVQAIMRVIATEDCDRAQDLLSRTESFSLDSQDITDLSPLVTLRTADTLILSGNQIQDLSPLAQLPNLTDLSLSNNQIQDLSPLAQLPNLTGLSLSNNQIQDLSPLQALQNLRSLRMSNNQVRDLSPLGSLERLELLDLSHNHIETVPTLGALKNLTHLSLCNNSMRRDRNLSTLTNLQVLDLSRNQLDSVETVATIKTLNTLQLDLEQVDDWNGLAELTQLNRLVMERRPPAPDETQWMLPPVSSCLLLLLPFQPPRSPNNWTRPPVSPPPAIQWIPAPPASGQDSRTP
jgi:internalin A